jgi:hypothetical protein
MKRFITILVFASLAFLANAQHRIVPVLEINDRTYEEVEDLILLMQRTAVIERMEGIKLDANQMTTCCGEFMLVRDVNSINIAHGEFTRMLNDHIVHPNHRWYDLKAITTELLIQNVKLFEYLSTDLQGNPHIKSMHIEVDHKSGASYIRINFYKL